MPSPTELLALVERSPELVAAKDRAGWVGLFAPDYQLADPVGSPVVSAAAARPGESGYAPLERFWDVFIAPNEITFDVERDTFSDQAVVRDVVLTTRMPSGATAQVPAHLRYTLTERDGGLAIQSMNAFWELPTVIRQVLKPTARNIRGLSAMQARLLRVQGLTGLFGFAGAARSVGRRGKRALFEVLAAASRGESDALALLGGEAPTNPRKVIAAGRHVSATVDLADGPGVLIADLDGSRIVAIEVYRTVR